MRVKLSAINCIYIEIICVYVTETINKCNKNKIQYTTWCAMKK